MDASPPAAELPEAPVVAPVPDPLAVPDATPVAAPLPEPDGATPLPEVVPLGEPLMGLAVEPAVPEVVPPVEASPLADIPVPAAGPLVDEQAQMEVAAIAAAIRAPPPSRSV